MRMSDDNEARLAAPLAFLRVPGILPYETFGRRPRAALVGAIPCRIAGLSQYPFRQVLKMLLSSLASGVTWSLLHCESGGVRIRFSIRCRL